MIRAESMLQKLLLTLVFILMSTVFVLAASAPASTTPDPSANPALANIVKMGAKVYYLGTRSGLDGWFIFKDGRVQVAYSPSDKKVLIIGAMFGENGESITSAQVKSLMETNKEVSNLMTSALQEQQAMGPASAIPQAALPPALQKNVPVAGTIVTPMPTAVAAPAIPVMQPAALTPGERLLQDFTSAPGVVLGNGPAKLYMVMDPNCPHCQAAWRLLRDAVFGNLVQIKMIPIAPSSSESERQAGQLLQAADPLNSWDKYVGPAKDQGDKTQLAGTPSQILIDALHGNHLLIESWHIDQTPYFAYRARDGKVKIVVGEPQALAALLSDIGP